MADPSIAQAVFLRGRSSLEDPTKLGMIVESTVFKHLSIETLQSAPLSFSYWKGKKDREVDIIVQHGERMIPLEIKYRSKQHTMPKDLQGLVDFCKERKSGRAYVITKDSDDLDVISLGGTDVYKVPAPLACYILSSSPSLFSPTIS